MYIDSTVLWLVDAQMRALWLRLHRWITLVFAIPLLVVIVTGLVLSFEPLAQQVSPGVKLGKAEMLALLARHDRESKATGLTLRSYEGTLTLAGVGAEGEIDIDLASGSVSEDEGFGLSDLFRTARGLHETLLLNLEWLVIASTFAMLVLGALGLLMGWPRWRNSFGGWHQGAAWVVLPLVILSPLTGLAIAYGFTFLPASQAPRGERITLREAVEKLAENAVMQGRDFSSVTSLRVRGGRMVARVFVDGSLANVVISRAGAEVQPRNWPRALHEGNWSTLGAWLNIIVSVVFMGLWGTGIYIWGRRKLRRRQPRGVMAAAAAAE
jgi:uncharacterized iron-regulated membrane protein